MLTRPQTQAPSSLSCEQQRAPETKTALLEVTCALCETDLFCANNIANINILAAVTCREVHLALHVLANVLLGACTLLNNSFVYVASVMSESNWQVK